MSCALGEKLVKDLFWQKYCLFKGLKLQSSKALKSRLCSFCELPAWWKTSQGALLIKTESFQRYETSKAVKRGPWLVFHQAGSSQNEQSLLFRAFEASDLWKDQFKIFSTFIENFFQINTRMPLQGHRLAARLEIIWKSSIFKNCILNLTIQKSCRFSVFIQRIIYWILLFDWFRKKIEVRRNTFGQHVLTKWYEYIFSHKFQWKSKFLLRAGDLQILKVLIIPFQVWWIPPDRVSFLLKKFEWSVMHKIISKSWYFTYKHISFKSRNVLMMRFGIFIYPPNTKKVKAFWYLLNWYV